jgi:hypothetical protein
VLLAGAAAVVVALVLLGNDPGPSAPAGSNATEIVEPAPAFTFRLVSVERVSSGEGSDAGPVAREAAGQIKLVLSQLYSQTFLDPANWREGTYEGAWALFAPKAAEAARADEATLSLGPDAGTAYDSVKPAGGSLKLSVLMDEAGDPFTAVATVKFAAKATETDGDVVVLVSTGEYFLRPVGDSWRIFGYEIERKTREPKGATP